MVSKQFGPDYILRFDKEELLVSSLIKFVKEHNIRPAWVQGLGAALWAEIGFYNLETKQYVYKKIDKTMEIGGLTGNITWTDNQPVAHLHLVLADENLHSYSGHLKELAVGGTCEVLLKTFDQAIGRKLDESTGLNLLDL